MKLFTATMAGLACALFLLRPAAAQVISIGEDGTARTLCTAYQNAPAPPKTTQPLPVPAVYAAMLQRAADAYALSPDLLDALARQESGYDQQAVSAKGAIGIMQLMPATARALHVDPHDPAQNIMGGAALLRQELDAFGGRLDLALAAYNAGQGAVVKYGGIPPYSETRAYVGQNLDKLASLSESAATSAPPGSGMASAGPVGADSYIRACP